MTCNKVNHRKSKSLHPFDAVPKEMFLKPNGNYYKMCLDCRKWWEKNRNNNHEKKKRELEVDSGKSYCSQCHSEKEDEVDLKLCVKCRQRSRIYGRLLKKAYNDLLIARVEKLGVCCEICRKIFLKNASGKGFIIVESLDGVSMDQIDICNIEFDHLTHDEQMEKYGQYYGAKIRGVAQMKSAVSMKNESKKCQLTCLMCHVKETKRRYIGHPRTEIASRIKYEFSNNVKLKIGKCQDCNTPIDKSVLAYYEFDHTNPATKTANISEMCMNSTYSLEDLKWEIPLCRVLCRYCHRVKTRTERILKE